MSTEVPYEGLQHRPISRRTVLRTAAHAAWMVPAIQAVSAAPAFAVSNVTTTISVTATVLRWSSTALNATFQLRVTVRNTGTAPTSLLLITLDFPSGWAPTTSTSGWTTDSNGDLLLTPPTPTLAAGQSRSYTVTINPADDKVGAGSYIVDGGGLTVVANATTAAPAVTAVNLAGAWPNLVFASGTGSWSRSRDGVTYYLTFSARVTNRGRSATTDLEVLPSWTWSGTFPAADRVSRGWAFEANPILMNKLAPQLAANGSSTVGARLQYSANLNGIAPAGTLTLTPRDNTTPYVAPAQPPNIQVPARTW